MTKFLFLGIVLTLIILPLVFDENSYAVKDIGTEGLFSTTGTEFPTITQVQSFEVDTNPPYIEITSPNHCSPQAFNESVLVEGVASDSDRVKMVEVFVHPLHQKAEIIFEPATPIAPDDWSKWSISWDIPDDSPQRILVHAYDYSGNEEWDESIINTERAKAKVDALEDESDTKIAFIEPTFTNAAYNLDSFYFFYSEYYFTPKDQEIVTDLDLLTGEIPLEYEIDYFKNIFNRVKQTVPNSFVTIIGDEEVHNGEIFDKDENLYDVLIFLHNEYVTQQYYDNMIEFLNNGGSIILLDGNMFYAEVLFDNEVCTTTLVKGHDWEFDGTSAKPSVSERYQEENTQWFGSNYIVNAIEDDIIFENNPFNYDHFEENHVTNPQAEILLDYRVKFAQPLEDPETNPFVLGGVFRKDSEVQYSDEGKTIATYELSSGKGKVIQMGLYSQNLGSSPAFLNYLEKIILLKAIDKTHSIESEYDIPDLYWLLPGGEIIDVKLNSETKTLSIKANFNPDDYFIKETSLSVVIPKSVLDSHIGDKMTDFVVTVNGNQVSYEETFDDVERSLKIKITENSNVEIIGTSAIPEFDLAVIVLIISISLVLLFSRKITKYPTLNLYGFSK